MTITLDFNKLPERKNIQVLSGDDLYWDMNYNNEDVTSYGFKFDLIRNKEEKPENVLVSLTEADMTVDTGGSVKFNTKLESSGEQLSEGTYYYNFKIIKDTIEQSLFVGSINIRNRF